MGSEREATRRVHRNACRKTPMIRVAVAAVVVLSSACATTTAPVAPRTISDLGDTPGASYAINVGDVLDIQFYTAPELNAEVPVRSDGSRAISVAWR